MSIFNDKALKSVAEAAAKIMQQEELKGSQHKIDANKNGKIDAHDFKLLRGKKDMKKEEVEQLDEVGDTPTGRKALGSYVNKAIADKSKDRTKGLRKATSRMYKDNFYGKKNEEVEINEEDTYSKDRYAVKDGKATKDNPSHMGSANYKDQPHHVWATSAEHAVKKSMKKEEVELDEAFPTVADAKKRMDAGKTQHGSVTRTATGLVHKRDFEHNAEDDDHPEKVGRPKGHGYGARQNYKRSTRVNEGVSFTEMLELYNEHGLKVLAPIETEEMDIDGTTIEVIDGDKVNGFVATIVEEPDNEQFTKELKDQEASAAGKKKQPKIAAGRTMGVKTMPESVEQIDELSKTTLGSYAHKASSSMAANALHSGYVRGSDTGHNLAVGKKGKQKDNSKLASQSHTTMKKREVGLGKAISRLAKEEVEQIDERELTKGEAKKKEDYVMGMKKKLSGFKQRYGERAKSVMYATATKMAKKD